jgi:hypothetical protein
MSGVLEGQQKLAQVAEWLEKSKREKWEEFGADPAMNRIFSNDPLSMASRIPKVVGSCCG